LDGLRTEELDLDRVLETISDLLDAFEDRLPEMRGSCPGIAGGRGAKPSGGVDKTKTSFFFSNERKGNHLHSMTNRIGVRHGKAYERE
jgi:hypothetical protein